jgi:CO/xanthine dehydrogenase Mo-binding subunit
MFNGEAARSCIMLAVQADGAELATVEGSCATASSTRCRRPSASITGCNAALHAGMLMTALDFLRTNPSPSDREIREGISAVLCRCTAIRIVTRSGPRAHPRLRALGSERARGEPAAARRARVARREIPSSDRAGQLRRRPPPAADALRGLLRSPHAHRPPARIDASAALALPGVVAVLTGEDIARAAKPVRADQTPSVKTTSFRRWPWAGASRGRGDRDGCAESRYVAEDAVEHIVVEFEPLPVVKNTDEALDPASPVLHEDAGTNLLVSREFARGDVDGALAGAALVVRERFRFHRHTPVCMENRGCLADYATGSQILTLRSSAQCPGLVRDILTDLLSMPEHQIRVIANDVGGGFGAKASLYPEEIATCVMARRLGRPVKWIGDRREDLLSTTHAWDEIVDAELGLNADGTIVGLRAQVTADVGAYSIYPWTAAIEPVQTISFLPGPYKVPTYRGRTRGVATRKAPLGPYRGVGGRPRCS